ncbi:MAG: DUF429 domain-containing protein [Acidimicrobiales bacterium]
MAVAGIDGCRGGWVVVTAGPGPSPTLTADVVTDLDGVVAAARAGQLAVVAIDIPIGLLDDRPRRCDVETRRLLGPRRASVFPAPLRPVLAATDYDDACRLSRIASGKALSKQTYHLLDRIRAVDELLEPDDGERIIEAHPECAFARLAGRPLESKHSEVGRDQRRRALSRALGRPFPRLLAASPAPAGDLLDAAALVCTARHLVAGTAIVVGGELDPTGKRAAVVY